MPMPMPMPYNIETRKESRSVPGKIALRQNTQNTHQEKCFTESSFVTSPVTPKLENEILSFSKAASTPLFNIGAQGIADVENDFCSVYLSPVGSSVTCSSTPGVGQDGSSKKGLLKQPKFKTSEKPVFKWAHRLERLYEILLYALWIVSAAWYWMFTLFWTLGNGNESDWECFGLAFVRCFMRLECFRIIILRKWVLIKTFPARGFWCSSKAVVRHILSNIYHATIWGKILTSRHSEEVKNGVLFSENVLLGKCFQRAQHFEGKQFSTEKISSSENTDDKESVLLEFHENDSVWNDPGGFKNRFDRYPATLRARQDTALTSRRFHRLRCEVSVGKEFLSDEWEFEKEIIKTDQTCIAMLEHKPYPECYAHLDEVSLSDHNAGNKFSAYNNMYKNTAFERGNSSRRKSKRGGHEGINDAVRRTARSLKGGVSRCVEELAGIAMPRTFESPRAHWMSEMSANMSLQILLMALARDDVRNVNVKKCKNIVIRCTKIMPDGSFTSMKLVIERTSENTSSVTAFSPIASQSASPRENLDCRNSHKRATAFFELVSHIQRVHRESELETSLSVF